MPNPASRLPARPSLEQLRKQAKERLYTLRAADPATTLADAQYVLAREYGFESWPKLVRHVEAVLSSHRLEEFDRLAKDILAAYQGDDEALRRLIAHYGTGYGPEQFHIRVQGRVNDARGDAPGEPSLADAQRMVAHEYGFESWAALAEGLAQPSDHTHDSRLGLSTAPPFYRIDARHSVIEPQPPLTDADWDTIFGVMKERGIGGIKTAAMTNSAMARLSRLEFVTSVDVGGARALTDDGLLHLARMPQLERLSLGGQLTDRAFAVLRQLPQLRDFAACWLQTVTDAGVANLAVCDHLESVDLMGTPTGDAALHALRGKRGLRDLKTGRLVTDAGLELLHDFPVFRTWQGGEIEYDLMTFAPKPNNLLLDGPFTDRGLTSLSALDGLFGLGFFWHARAFTAAGLAALAGLPNLGFLGCQGERCDDAAMRSIAMIPTLRMLMAQGAVATDDGWVALSRSPNLEYLWGRECPNLHGRGFAAMAAMPALRGLGVSCRNVDDASLATLPRFAAFVNSYR
jgi:hypothetical protein